MPSPPAYSNDLLLLYDEFTEFQSLCMFLCDTVVALTIAELVMDKRSMNGLHMCAVQIKDRAEALEEKLLGLREKSTAT